MKKRRNRITGVRTGAPPTKERRRQNGGVICETVAHDGAGKALITRYKARWESPLDAYKDHGVIDGAEYKAGQRFHRAYYGSVICRKMDLKPTHAEHGSLQMTACDRTLNQAYAAMPSDTRDTVVNVCGYSRPAANPAALEKLRKGLGHLAVRWHMAAIETCEHKRKPD